MSHMRGNFRKQEKKQMSDNKMTVLKPVKTSIRKKALLSPKEVETLKSVYARSLADHEFKVFLMVCERTKLDPFKKQVYAVKRKSSDGKEVMTIQTGIDGFRALAMRTGKYAGQDDVVFEEDGSPYPKKATVTVYSIIQGMRVPFTASARWSEYFPGERLGFMWKKMPHTMLGKVAEALALRKMAPEDTSGLYLEEEMQQAGVVQNIQPTVEAPKQKEEAIEAEFQDMDNHIRSMSMEQVAGETIAMAREMKKSVTDTQKIEILGKLIGNGKPFGAKVKDAKTWCEEIVKTDWDKFSEKDCDEVLKVIGEKK